MELKQPRQKTEAEALAALADRCAKAEVCIADARRLLFRWAIAPQARERIIEKLISDRFIDEERYAQAFVRDKLSFSRWGNRKIAQTLADKHIPHDIISRALEQVDPEQQQEKLETDLRRKLKSIEEKKTYKKKEKLLRFGLSRGFTPDQLIPTINHLVEGEEEEWQSGSLL
ncbi:MAG: RecX family transcriptional regulator [Rikenellaceae bacterium]|jgi:regulatory protein|nr:RecX family transcriptional regulator [Rikenellaceae bacterium]